nr:unnamed protein product [Callosobruchus chinensis]
MKRLQTL